MHELQHGLLPAISTYHDVGYDGFIGCAGVRWCVVKARRAACDSERQLDCPACESETVLLLQPVSLAHKRLPNACRLYYYYYYLEYSVSPDEYGTLTWC